MRPDALAVKDFLLTQRKEKEMRVPDCRTDEYYNEKYLEGSNKDFVRGYDWATEQALNLLNNTEVFPDFMDMLDPNKAIVNVDKEEIVRKALEDWMESQRDMLITSMIDGMGEEYDEIKARVDSGSESE